MKRRLSKEAKAAIAAAQRQRWERYWDAKQADEDRWAEALGVPAENVRLTQKRHRPDAKEMAERREARAFNRAQRELDQKARDHRRAEKQALEAIKNGVPQ